MLTGRSNNISAVPAIMRESAAAKGTKMFWFAIGFAVMAMAMVVWAMVYVLDVGYVDWWAKSWLALLFVCLGGMMLLLVGDSDFWRREAARGDEIRNRVFDLQMTLSDMERTVSDIRRDQVRLIEQTQLDDEVAASRKRSQAAAERLTGHLIDNAVRAANK